MQLRHQRLDGTAHRGDRAAPGAGLADLLDRGPGVRRHLAMVYVGNDAERLAQDPDVYHRRGTTLLDETITDVRHLGAFGVQGADDDDVWRHSQSWISGSTWALACSTIQS